MKLRLFFLSTLLWMSSTLWAQNMARVSYNLDTLCAPGMHGRGASGNGDKVAAQFIHTYFERFKLLPLDSSFEQKFTYDINTFEGKVLLQANKKTLNTGTDYILNPASGKGKGTYKVVKLDSAVLNNTEKAQQFFKQNLSKKVLVFPARYMKWLNNLPKEYLVKIYNSAGLIELVDKKLTASLSDEQLPCPYFTVLSERMPVVPSKVKLHVDAVLKEKYTSQNVLGYVPGIVADSFVLVTAHYDHLGRMGKATYFPGANDNASGVSMLIELASYFKRVENKPRYSIVFVAFAAEEAGLIGSKYFTEHPLVPLSKIKFLLNLDLLGTGDEGMMVVNGALHEQAYNRLQNINTDKNYLPAIKKRGKAANSDHYWFTEKGVPAFFFYTLGGVSYYHDVLDRPATLPLTKFREVYRLIIDFVEGVR